MSEILLVEDDEALAGVLRRVLRREGYVVDVEVDAVVGLEKAEKGLHDLIILDLLVSNVEGVDLCQRLRQKGVTVPVLILTARAGETDVVVGLDAGADAYVTKPFRLAELLARVRALVRWHAHPKGADDSLITLNIKAHLVFVDGQELSLTVKEFDLLRVLVREDGRVVTRKALMDEVWGGCFGSSKTLDMHISTLRHKLHDDAHDPRHIITTRGVGFRFQNQPAHEDEGLHVRVS